jgi:inner membrane protease ATP23
MEDTMAHELIHAFDHCRFKVDWNNLRHHACSEVSLLEMAGASARYYDSGAEADE